MTFERFTQLLEVYGSDLRTWPDLDRTHGTEFLMQSAEARLVWQEAHTLDRWLHESAPSPSGDDLVDLIVDRAKMRPRIPQTDRHVRTLRASTYRTLQAAALAGVFLLGLVLGLTVPSVRASSESLQDIVSMVYDPTRMGGWTP